jgi:radical SAM superfamily enzyme YgiQ (UPF0313 family)
MKILLVTPPFTQLNTPYPATAYLKAVLERESHSVRQIDLGNRVAEQLFSSEGLKRLFKDLSDRYSPGEYPELDRFISLKEAYMSTIDLTASFLKGEDNSPSYRINSGKWLPEGDRQEQLPAGSTLDDARHRATLYLEEIGDIITSYCDSFYGFSRYAERIALSPPHFSPVEEELNRSPSLIRSMAREIFEEILKEEKPDVCGFSVPFPGNLLGALDSAKVVKEKYNNIKTVMGGGYVNTELRDLAEPALFQYMDFVTLDDGERPLINICRFLNGEIKRDRLLRTFLLNDINKVTFINGDEKDFRQAELPAPDYSGLMDRAYFSLLPLTNPMHRLWSDGKWNKMTLAHGCYWNRCAFCDTSLDYIRRYDPDTASSLADKMETVIEQTGIRAFHFVDEAAPPALLRDLSIELIRRNLNVSWWTNIRFEKSFSADLCRLMAKSGCIAVSGGLEVASDRLLKRIDKGVTVPQVAAVAENFHHAGILVHAYLMYAFPGQKEEEVVESLEKVRQLFQEGLIDSAFWHQFALTAHSPVGCHPDTFDVIITGPEPGDFARNDLLFHEERNYDPDDYSFSLAAATNSYMERKGFEFPIKKWFPFKIPKIRTEKNYIRNILAETRGIRDIKETTQLLWTGSDPLWVDGFLELHDRDGAERIPLKKNEWKFLSELVKVCHIKGHETATIRDLEALCRSHKIDPEQFLHGDLLPKLSAYGLLLI